jgi:hypothetical protein
MRIEGNLTASAGVIIKHTTNSSGTNSGALTVAGGVGIGGDLYVGGETMYMASLTSQIRFNGSASRMRGIVFMDYNTDYGYTGMGTQTGLFRFNLYRTDSARYGWYVASGDGSVGSGTVATEVMSLQGNGILTVSSTTEATSSTTGTLIVSGGAGIAKSLRVGEEVETSSLRIMDYTGLSYIQSSVSKVGGEWSDIVFAPWYNATPKFKIASTYTMVYPTTTATSTDSGALQVIGGAGIGGDLYVGGNIYGNFSGTTASLVLTGTDDATSTDSGTLQVIGGVGIGKSMFAKQGTIGTVELDSTITGNSALTFYATFAEHFDADVADGSATATTYGDVNIAGGYLNCDFEVEKPSYITFVGGANTPMTSTGAIRFKFKYHADMGIETELLNISNGTDDSYISIGNAGTYLVFYIDNSSTTLVSCYTATYAFEIETEYEVEVNFNTSAQTYYIFINGVLQTLTYNVNVSGTFTQGTLISINNYSTEPNSYREFSIYNAIQHTTSYTPSTFFAINDGTSMTSGAVVIKGGLGMTGSMNVGDTIKFNSLYNNKRLVFNDYNNDDNWTGIGNRFMEQNYHVRDIYHNHSFYAGINSTSEQLLMDISGRLDAPYSGVKIYHTTESTDITTGALVVNGGIGVAGNIITGGSVNTTGTCGIVLTSNATHADAGSNGLWSTPSGYVGWSMTRIKSGTQRWDEYIDDNTDVVLRNNTGSKTVMVWKTDGSVSIPTAVGATSSSTGSLQVVGGVGIGGELYLGSTSATKKKLVMYDTSYNDFEFYGIGIQSSELRYQVNRTVSHHSFYAGINSTSEQELMRIEGNLAASAGVSIKHTTESSGTNTGALTVAGGVGIGGKLYTGGALDVAGTIYSHTSTNNMMILRGSTSGNVGVSMGESDSTNGYMRFVSDNTLHVGLTSGGTEYDATRLTTTVYQVLLTTDSGATNTGALTVAGGIGVAKDVYARSVNSVFASASDYTSHLYPSMANGNNINFALGKALSTNNACLMRYSHVSDGSTSNYVDFGMYGTSGGIGGLRCYASGDCSAYAVTDSASTSTGSLQTRGGVGIAKSLYVGTKLQFPSTLTKQRIILFDSYSDTYRYCGFGMQSGELRYQVDVTPSAHAFYSGVSSTLDQQLMRIEGNLAAGKGVSIYHNAESTSSSLGALTVAGGVGIAKYLTVNKLRIQGDADITRFRTFSSNHRFLFNYENEDYNSIYFNVASGGSASAYFFGNVTVAGTLTKGGGSFLIPHPNLAKEGWKLRHCFVESPTRGDNLYRYQITTTDCHASITLPEYYTYLNENTQVWITAVDVLGFGRGIYDESTNTVSIEVNTNGTYNILVIGTRKDQMMKDYWDKYGPEVPPEVPSEPSS